MKENRIQRPHKHLALAITGIVLLAGVVIALVLGYDRLREIYLEQCVITDMAEQVSISSGRMVKADVLAENFGLRKGANLALIDFAAKRRDILERIPNLRSISIRRRLPDRVTITFEEREPIARLNLQGNKGQTGKVVDVEGVVFLCQRGTDQLPIIREASSRGTAVGQHLKDRSRAALKLLDACRSGDFPELGLLEVDTTRQDFLLATLGGTYSRAKIAWEDMDLDTPASRTSMLRQLTNLQKAIRTRAGDGAVLWNATDYSVPGRIYADMKGAL